MVSLGAVHDAFGGMDNHPDQALPGQPFQRLSGVFFHALATLAGKDPYCLGGILVPPKAVIVRCRPHGAIPAAGSADALIGDCVPFNDRSRIRIGQRGALGWFGFVDSYALFDGAHNAVPIAAT